MKLLAPDNKMDHQETDSGAKPSDRRRFFRVQDHIALKFRQVLPAELEELISNLSSQETTRLSLPGTFAATSRRMEHLLRKIKETQPDLATYLKSLNEKLDIIARALFMENSDLADVSPCEVDLSASGVAFRSEVYLKPGGNIELKLLIFPSLIHITTIGVVIRSERSGEPSERPYDVAVDFDFIREKDRELIIQHVLRKEVSDLRKEQ